MLIYRLEVPNVDGHFVGVFDSGVVNKARNAVYDPENSEPDPYRHPTPDRDIPEWDDLYESGESHYYFCGFSSIDQLLNWFDSEKIRIEMKRLGAVLQIYEIEETKNSVFHGKMQIVFLKARARLIKTTDIPTINKEYY